MRRYETIAKGAEAMTDTQDPDVVALQPCPFCNQHLRVVPSLALAFDPPRPLVEYHHHSDDACIIRRAMWAFYDDEPEKFATFAAKWNNRLSTQSAMEARIEKALASAYLQGATDVHSYWVENPGEAPRGDPEFGEAASDYAKAALDAFDSSARATLSNIGGSNDG